MKNLIGKKAQTLAILLAASAMVTACGKKEIDDLPPASEGTVSSGYGDGQNNTANTIRAGSQQDFVNSVGFGNDRIFFDTDRYNIDSRDQVSLQTQAGWLSKYPNARITLEGHADERGTRDYNLALGERRANAAKNYLVSLGISAARIRTVSYGKERPEALGSNEASWAKNRRAVTIIVE